VSRRDAAVAAALTGAVVVVLGYASGLGIQTDSTSLAQPPVQTAPVVPEPAMTMPVEPTLPAMTMTPEMVSAPDVPMDMPTLLPTDTTTTEPTTEPTPGEPTPTTNFPQTTCPPALLEQLPVVGPATTPVTSLLISVLGSLPVVGDLTGPVLTTRTPGSVACILGTVVGPQCCDDVAVARRTKVAK
jgi:hypothetical protein